MEEEEKSETAARYLAFIANRTEALKQLTEELFRYSVILAVRDTMQLEMISVNAVWVEREVFLSGKKTAIRTMRSWESEN